jgi:hypothetical protein
MSDLDITPTALRSLAEAFKTAIMADWDISNTALRTLAGPSVPESDWAERTARGFMAIAEAFKYAESAYLDLSHTAGWSIGDTASWDVERGGRGIVHVVLGSDGENAIRAEGKSTAEAWRSALSQAAAVGTLPEWPRSAVM